MTKCYAWDSCSGLMADPVIKSGNTLLTGWHHSCPLHSCFSGDSKAVLHYLISTYRNPPFYKKGRDSFCNPELLDLHCPEQIWKAIRRQVSLWSLASLKQTRWWISSNITFSSFYVYLLSLHIFTHIYFQSLTEFKNHKCVFLVYKYCSRSPAHTRGRIKV